MKKLAICILFAGILIASHAQASSLILKPSVITTSVGKTFTLPVVVDPVGIRGYTARLSLSFPPDMLEVTSFTFGKSWLAVDQPGYDALDNKNGQLIKTAGFPKGFVSQVPFGTITFRAKKAGDSTITVRTESFVLNANSESTLESRPQVLVTATLGAAPEVSTPPGEENLFDISLAPAQAGGGPSVLFFILLFLIAVVLGLGGYFIVVKIRHRSFMKKIKHDETRN